MRSNIIFKIKFTMKTYKVLFFVIFIASINFNGICTQGTIGKIKSKTPLKKTGSFSSSKGNDKTNSDGSVYDNYQKSKNDRTPLKKSSSFSSFSSQSKGSVKKDSDGSVYDNYQGSKNDRTPFKKSGSFSSLPSQSDSVIDKKRTASFAFSSDKDERKRHQSDSSLLRKDASDGTHGQRKKEINSLSKRHQIPIDAKTHESEHVIAYKALANDVPRRTPEGRKLESIAPAFQQVKDLHRAHPGTGSGKEADLYRKSQRKSMKNGHLSNAIQLNTLGYAENPNYIKSSQTSGGKASHDSFENMILKNPKIPPVKKDGEINFMQMNRIEQKEVLLANKLASEGRKVYTKNDLKEVREKFRPFDEKMNDEYLRSD
jgi:hypothetical protein